jgi:hypothetical protein
MKRTELEKRERELKRKQKKEVGLSKKPDTEANNPGHYINALFSRFRYDKTEIFNIETDITILEVLENIKADLPQKQWDNVLKKAIKKTGIELKEKALKELNSLLTS